MTSFYHQTSYCIRHAIRLCMIARGQASTFMVKAVVSSAPRSEDEIYDKRWREKSMCWKMLIEADVKHMHDWAQHDFNESSAFWLQFYPYLPKATQNAIIAWLEKREDLFSDGGMQPLTYEAQHQVLDPIPDESRQVVAFPFGKMKPEECAKFRDGVFQLKLEAAQLLNRVAAGVEELTPKGESTLAEVNKLCTEAGILPLDYESRS